MKTFIASALFCCCLFLVARSQTIASCSPDSAVVGQSLTVSIIGQGVNFTNATGTYLKNGQSYLYPLAFNVVSGTQITATYSIPPNTLLGYWDVVVGALPANVSLPAGFWIGTGVPNGSYGRVNGVLYNDANLDCVKNVGEQGLSHRTITFTPGPYNVMTDANGAYNVWLPLGNYFADYHPTFPVNSFCPPTGQLSLGLTTNGQVLSNQNFATNVIPYSDARVLVSGLRLRPGFTCQKYLNIHNFGNTAIPSALVKVVKPSFASFGSFSHPPDYVSGDTVAWTVSNLQGMATRSYQLYCPPNIVIGTPYNINGSVTPTPMDNFPNNNGFSCAEDVVGAWDPNDKRVFLPSGADADGDILSSDTMLTYIVRFQNTGTDTAYNIYVRDTLDLPNLDMNGFRILGASHPYQVTMSPGGQLEFAFPNIMLPDSGANQLASNGYFTYEVAPKAGLPLGTVIDNSASIYFDFNAPVKTNTTHTRICDALNAGYVAAPNGLTVQFTDQSAGTVQGYFWDFGDGNTSTQQNPIHTYAAGGSYTVCLIANGICRSDTHCQNATLVGMADALPGFSISLIPNPMGRQSVILVENAGLTGAYKVDMYDVRGQRVRQLDGNLNVRTTFDRGNLGAGFYFYRVHQDGITLGSGRLIISWE